MQCVKDLCADVFCIPAKGMSNHCFPRFRVKQLSLSLCLLFLMGRLAEILRMAVFCHTAEKKAFPFNPSSGLCLQFRPGLTARGWRDSKMKELTNKLNPRSGICGCRNENPVCLEHRA